MNWRRIFKGPIPAPLGLGLLGAAPILGIMLHYLFLDNSKQLPDQE